jgi:hypothetical protein
MTPDDALLLKRPAPQGSGKSNRNRRIAAKKRAANKRAEGWQTSGFSSQEERKRWVDAFVDGLMRMKTK